MLRLPAGYYLGDHGFISMGHEHGILTFTLHQCLKYYRDGEEKINSDVKPFTKVESHFADVRFFEEGIIPKKTMSLAISSIGKGAVKKASRQEKMILLSNSLRKKQVSKVAPLLVLNKLLNRLPLQWAQCHQF